jgi:hypothetical protein
VTSTPGEPVVAGGSEKLIPVRFAPLMVMDWLVGMKVKPLLLGVTV